MREKVPQLMQVSFIEGFYAVNFVATDFTRLQLQRRWMDAG